MARIIFNVAVKCDKAGRKQNQDNFWLSTDVSTEHSWIVNDDIDVPLSPYGAVFVVADGMGGENAGDKASEIVVRCIEQRFNNIPSSALIDDKSILSFISDSIVFADKNVKDYARNHPEAEGLGSTIVLLWLLNGKAYCGWCGDSRIYRFNPNNKLVRLSHDHSYVQTLVDEGKIDESEAFDHPDGNIINRSLGDNGAQAKPETKVYDIFERDVFLLCSDGLCGLLKDSEIEDIIAIHSSSTKDALNALWTAGDKAGWNDNATIELVSIGSGGQIAKGVPQGYPAVIPPKKKDKAEPKKNIKNPTKKEKTNKSSFIALSLLGVAILVVLFLWMYPFKETKHQSNTEFTVTLQEQQESNVAENHTNEFQVSPPPTQSQPQKPDKPNQGQPQKPNKPNQGQPQKPNKPNQAEAQAPNEPNPVQPQTPNQQNLTPQQIEEQLQGSAILPGESLKPSADYVNQLNATSDDYARVNSIWNVVKSKEYIPNQGVYQQLMNFAKNVAHLSDPNNSDFKKLNDRDKQIVYKWASLAREIKNNINKYPLGAPNNPDYYHPGRNPYREGVL